MAQCFIYMNFSHKETYFYFLIRYLQKYFLEYDHSFLNIPINTVLFSGLSETCQFFKEEKELGEKTKIVRVGKLKVGKTPTKYILRQNKANLVENTKMLLRKRVFVVYSLSYLQFVGYLKIVCSRDWSGPVYLVTLHYIIHKDVVIHLNGCWIFSLLNLFTQKASCFADLE